MQPKDGSEGLYSLCHGEAKRGMVAFAPRQTVYMYNEANAFWEVKLAENPQLVVEHAKVHAADLIAQAKDVLATVEPGATAYAPLKELFGQSETAYVEGMSVLRTVSGVKEHQAIYANSKALRAFNQTQVRALQVIQAVNPPPCKPEDLGL